MQIIWNCNFSPKKYQEHFNNLSFPKPRSCPSCKSKQSLKGHGTYSRNLIECCDTAVTGYAEHLTIKVKRWFCRSCHKTCSLLPSFAVPKFQYSLKFILQCLQCIFLNAPTIIFLYRQLKWFYKSRFMKAGNINNLIMFLRKDKPDEHFSEDRHKKATKLIAMLGAHPHVTNFSRSFHRIYNNSFMAK